MGIAQPRGSRFLAHQANREDASARARPATSRAWWRAPADPTWEVGHFGAKDTRIINSEFNFYLRHAYAKPKTTPRIRKAKYTL